MTLKTHWALLCVVLLGLLASAPARAEDYPSRTITIVVSLAAGSGMDVMTRLYAEKLSEAFGKPVIVENKPGAATTLAANHVANAPPDGLHACRTDQHRVVDQSDVVQTTQL
jgi:tripartite-type tricarboxylate transporter receptor subunit TctC